MLGRGCGCVYGVGRVVHGPATCTVFALSRKEKLRGRLEWKRRRTKEQAPPPPRSSVITLVLGSLVVLRAVSTYRCYCELMLMQGRCRKLALPPTRVAWRVWQGVGGAWLLYMGSSNG